MDEKAEAILVKRVEITGFCWLWVKGINNCGYGQVYADKRVQSAHRWVYELLVGPIPEGLQLDHLCSIRNCVNPDHLEPVTKRENALRMVIRRGWVVGGKGTRVFGPKRQRARTSAGPYKLPLSQREFCVNGHSISEVGYRNKIVKGKVYGNCNGCAKDYSARRVIKVREKRSKDVCSR